MFVKWKAKSQLLFATLTMVSWRLYIVRWSFIWWVNAMYFKQNKAERGNILLPPGIASETCVIHPFPLFPHKYYTARMSNKITPFYAWFTVYFNNNNQDIRDLSRHEAKTTINTISGADIQIPNRLKGGVRGLPISF